MKLIIKESIPNNMSRTIKLQVIRYLCGIECVGSRHILHSVPECGSETLKCPKAPANFWDLPR